MFFYCGDSNGSVESKNNNGFINIIAYLLSSIRTYLNAF